MDIIERFRRSCLIKGISTTLDMPVSEECLMFSTKVLQLYYDLLSESPLSEIGEFVYLGQSGLVCNENKNNV